MLDMVITIMTHVTGDVDMVMVDGDMVTVGGRVGTCLSDALSISLFSRDSFSCVHCSTFHLCWSPFQP